ncbi:MAG: radical SAM protein [Elusimicrobiota bacterium]
MERADLKLGFSCNNRCVFCVQGDKRYRFSPRDEGSIRRALEEGLIGGSRSLVLTGGEPTMQPSLLETVRLARGMGYDTVQIQSNGRRFFYKDFCRELIAAGANEFSPALHGSCAAIHDGLTRSPGSFLQTAGGILNLKTLGQKVIVNTVVTESNCRDLPLLADLLVRLGVDQFQFAFIHILGEAEKNSKRIVPKKSLAAPFIREGMRIGRDAGIPCFTEAVPYCFMRGYEDCVAERIIPETVIYDAERTVSDYTVYRLAEGKAKGPRCPSCRYFKVCEGPWREYPRLFGWGEFDPVENGSS